MRRYNVLKQYTGRRQGLHGGLFYKHGIRVYCMFCVSNYPHGLLRGNYLIGQYEGRL